ncbi:MAG: phage holin family protein [Sphingomicrobium sp.]
MLKRVDSPLNGDDDRPIGDMIGQVFDDGRAYAHSEIDLIKVKARAEVNRYRQAALIAAAGAALALAALVAFAMTLVIGFARLIGPFGGGAAAIAILGLGAYVLFNLARQRLEQMSSDEDDDDDGDD